MTHNESPSLHAILEELPSEDDLPSSGGESYGSPLLRTCSTMIPVRAPNTIIGGDPGILGSSSKAARNHYINNRP
jgi:hypothetical protein